MEIRRSREYVHWTEQYCPCPWLGGRERQRAERIHVSAEQSLERIVYGQR